MIAAATAVPLPVRSANVVPVIVVEFIDSLNVAVIDVVVATPEAPDPGAVVTTVGGVVSAAAFTVTVVVAVAVPEPFAADSV